MVRAYLDCALLASNDESTPSGGEPLDENYSIGDIEKKSIEQAKKDCETFAQVHSDLIAASKLDDDIVGHSLWLSRNEHGAGFFDWYSVCDKENEKAYEACQKLQEEARRKGGRNLYVWRGKVYIG